MNIRDYRKSVDRASSGIDRLIDGIPHRTRDTIRNLFYFLVFVMVVAGAVYGVNRGRESAKIKSAPIIDTTNEAFEVRMKQEREGGDFSAMLDTELINEMKRVDMEKVQFPTRVNLEPELDSGIMEPERRRPETTLPEPGTGDPILDGNYGRKPVIESEVGTIEKRTAPPSVEGNAVMDAEKRSITPLDSPLDGNSGDAMKAAPEPGATGERRNLRKGDIRAPGPLIRDEGIIGN